MQGDARPSERLLGWVLRESTVGPCSNFSLPHHFPDLNEEEIRTPPTWEKQKVEPRRLNPAGF